MSEFTEDQIADEGDKALNADIEEYMLGYFPEHDEDRCRFHNHRTDDD